MKTSSKILIITSALTVCLACVNANAQIGGGDPFAISFDENGHATLNLEPGTATESGFAQVDPNTGRLALTYALPSNIGGGILTIYDEHGGVSDDVSFYNIGSSGFLAYYSTLPGTDLADTISGGYVVDSGFGVTEVNDAWSYYAGGVPLANNDYYGTSSDASAPDGGSTLAMLGGVFALAGALNRKFRK
jgi:hypothetical protein